MISAPLLEAILNYLTTRPYREVSGFIKAAQQEIDQQQAAQQTEEKGEE
mgnify:CR=1 FL=1